MHAPPCLPKQTLFFAQVFSRALGRDRDVRARGPYLRRLFAVPAARGQRTVSGEVGSQTKPQAGSAPEADDVIASHDVGRDLQHVHDRDVEGPFP